MNVIKPKPILGGSLVNTSAQPTNPQWDIGTSYTEGQLVEYGFSTFENVMVTPNLGNYPGSDETKWLIIGPSNEWAMFDSTISTSTIATGYGVTTVNIEVVIKTGSIDSLAILNAVGDKASITLTDGVPGAPGTTIVMPQTWQSLQGSVILDWYQYFFVAYAEQRTQALFMDLPGLLNENLHAVVRIEANSITASNLAVSIGALIFGNKSVLGTTAYGMTSGIIDYSSKETNEYGETNLVVRNYSKRLNADVTITNTEFNKVQRLLYSLRAVPALWIATSDPSLEEASVVYGFYRDFSTSITYPSHSICSIEIEGLI